MSALFTLKHLRYFLSLVEHKHFGRAAEANFITQPTLSAAIREFEEILGLQVLERTKRRVIVTPIGAEVAEHARDILLRADNLDGLCRSFQNPLSGRLRLGIIPTIAPFLLPRIMPQIRKKFPDLTLFLKEDQTASLLNDLDEGRLDVLILALPYDYAGIQAFSFMDDPFYLAVPHGHDFSSQKTIKSSDLEKQNLLLLEEGHCLRDHALNACQLTSVSSAIDYGATSLHTLIEMVASGMGSTLLPEMAIHTEMVRNSSIQTIPLAASMPDRKIALIWRKTSGLTKDFEILGEFLKTL